VPLGPSHTVLLALDVSATATGRILDPFIEVEHDCVSYRQYFERGVGGTRYLNLSPAVQQSGVSSSRRIALRGRHIRWKPDASLIVFDSPAIGSGDTLIVAPHPDDSEIGAFGLYSTCRSWIVTVSCGERSPTDLSPMVARANEQTHWRALLRVFDSLAAPELGGVPRERRLNLVFPDARLKQMHDNPMQAFRLGCEDSLPRRTLRSRNPVPELWDAPAGGKWGDLVAELRWTLDTVRPRTVLCTHPLVDPHLDHVFTSIALAEALRGGAYEPGLFLLYVVHANEAPLYPFGSAASVVSLPPWEHKEWIADSIYSHSLSEDTRRAKFFAVEAAHDLRVYSDASPRSLRQLMTVLRRELSAFVTGMGLHPTDFLRRAPRPNELYYVVSAQGFLELAQRALAQAPVFKDPT
jgi:LmbE family N-acetylglucosaminyl deacetylase